MLIPFLGYCIIQKQGGKKDAAGPIGFNDYKVVLILLTKVLII